MTFLLRINDLFHDRYKLIQKLGVGGYSEVWLAEDIESANLNVAIKIFAPGSGLDTEGLKIFSSEYALVFNLNHNSLLKPNYYDKWQGMPYLVMKYMSKGSCGKHCGKMTEREIGRFMFQICEAIDYLHSQNPPIIHQDIKPDNVLIDGNDNYVLTDFGISTTIRRTLTRSMGKNDINNSGTTPYMAPERFSKDLAERTPEKCNDIFSFGVTAFELMTGELPYGEFGGMVANTGNKPAVLPEKFSRELQIIIDLCLQKDSWKRPTASELFKIAKNYTVNEKWEIPQRLSELYYNNTSHLEEEVDNNSRKIIKTAIKKGEFKSFVKKSGKAPDEKQKNKFFLELVKKYGVIDSNDFNRAIENAIENSENQPQEFPPQKKALGQSGSLLKNKPFAILSIITLCIIVAFLYYLFFFKYSGSNFDQTLVLLNSSVEKINISLAEKNNKLYSDFEKQLVLSREKVLPLYEKAMTAKNLTSDLIENIVYLNNEIEVNKNTVTKEKANKLKSDIDEYRRRLVELVEENERNSIDMNISTDDYTDAKGDKINWYSINFDCSNELQTIN